MEPLHSRVAPCVLHTLDDLVFAAFQGPVLSLSSRVLHRYRAFSALLLLRARWRSEWRLSQDDVTAALLKARCRLPSTLEAAECRRCGGVLEVSENTAEQQRLRRQLPKDVELYAVTVRTRCTSSRKHVGSTMLVLAVELAAGVVVVSDSFAIYARHAARHVAAPDHQRSPAPRSPGSADSSPGAAPEESSSGSGSDSGPPALLSPCARALWGCSGGGGMAVGVCVMAVRGFTAEDHQAIAAWLVPVLRSRVPGYLVQKTSVQPTVIIMIVGARTADDLELVNALSQRFTKNAIPNPLGRDLVAEGRVQQLLVVSNKV
eukprot:m51a1_g7054 hypothetical protein (318) ;mRNA; r:160847-161886